MYLTLQAVNGPLLKLLEGDLRRGRQHVEVEPVLIILLLEFGFGELLLLVVEIGASLGINSGVVVADHDSGGVYLGQSALLSCDAWVSVLKWQARRAQRVNWR